MMEEAGQVRLISFLVTQTLDEGMLETKAARNLFTFMVSLLTCWEVMTEM